MRTQILTILLAGLFASSYQQSKPVNLDSIPTISYCELVRKPNLYAAKTVRVKATWEYGFEWSFLYDRGCMSKGNRAWVEFEDEDKLCSMTKKNLKKLKNRVFDNKADVVIVGKLFGIAGGFGYGHLGDYGFQFVASCLEDAKPIPSNLP